MLRGLRGAVLQMEKPARAEGALGATPTRVAEDNVTEAEALAGERG